jgi:hypothetical protein
MLVLEEDPVIVPLFVMVLVELPEAERPVVPVIVPWFVML